MEDFKLTIENGIVTFVEDFKLTGEGFANGGDTLPNVESLTGRLFIPKEVTGFDGEALCCINAEAIEADPENKVYYAKGNALYKKGTDELVIACKSTVLPDDGSITKIGDHAFNVPYDLSGMDLSPLVIPESVKRLGFRAFAITSDNDVHIVIPAADEIAAMSLMVYAPKTEFTIKGNPKMEAGVFGTKAESKDSNIGVYKEFPEVIYINTENLTVYCDKDSTVEAYCNKYGITCKVI